MNKGDAGMGDEHYAPKPIARWFMIAAVASLLFMVLGCVTYVMHVMTDPYMMSLDQRMAYEAEPAWLTGAYAVAVWIGLAGTVLLVLKKKLAEPALLISLAATFVWLAGLLLVSGVRDAMSANDLIVALCVTAITSTIYWFARHSRMRGWLN